MEEIRKILEQKCVDFDASISESESDLDIDSFEGGFSLPNTTETLRSACKKNGTVRMPTRRPDPNVYNRNALLARENRRRKKAYLEAIEKELEEARNKNKSLLRALKKQVKVTQKLEKEKKYFKNVLANYKDIANLSALLKPKVPLTPAISTDGESSSPETECAATPISTPNSENDYHQPTSPYNYTWCDVLEENRFGFSPSSTITAEDELHGISEEHSYFKDSTLTDFNANNGVCLHTNSGQTKFEICPTCHWNASRTPPSQLLQDED